MIVDGYLYPPNCSRGRRNHKIVHHHRHSFSSNFNTDNDNHYNDKVPSFVSSIVLQQAYPSMIRHMAEFGNPNIPLGSADGKRCQTLRRLAFENKLSEEEINLLEEMNFRFNSLEDIYEDADFDEYLDRLIK